MLEDTIQTLSAAELDQASGALGGTNEGGFPHGLPTREPLYRRPFPLPHPDRQRPSESGPIPLTGVWSL